MKILVDELPHSCLGCLCYDYYPHVGDSEPIGQTCRLLKERILMPNASNSRHPNCPLKELSGKNILSLPNNIASICDLLDMIIKQNKSDSINDQEKPLSNKYYHTYSESNDCDSPSMSEGYPCIPGTKVLLHNEVTGAVKVDFFIPEILTTNWKVIYYERPGYIDYETDLRNLLAHFGWYRFFL